MSVKLTELREPRLEAREPRLEARDPRLLPEDTVRVLADRLKEERSGVRNTRGGKSKPQHSYDRCMHLSRLFLVSLAFFSMVLESTGQRQTGWLEASHKGGLAKHTESC